MTTLASAVDLASEGYARRRQAMLGLVARLDELLAQTRAGGGERYVQRHRERGKLLPRERIELLLDRDTAFLELQPFAAYETPFAVGASTVTGIGVVEGVECVIVANDATIRGGTMNPYTLRKAIRAMEIAMDNRLPFISLVESGGADLPTQAELFVPAGEGFRRQAQMSRARIPNIAVVFGNATAGGAYTPGMADYTIFIEDRSKVFLGGPPLVKMATGEESDDEALGGAGMHSRVSGLSDYLALDERDALRLCRQVVRRLNRRKHGPGPTVLPVREPCHDPEELAGIAATDLREPFDMREVLARVVDASDYDEFKPAYGTSLTTGWAAIHGFPVGVIANQRGIIFSEEAQKATQFIQLCNQADVPLLFLHNVTGYMVGREYEQRGIIKHGAQMINAVSNSTVPHISVICGGSYGAGNYGMSGRSYRPRFLFAWPNAKVAVMGGAQLAGVLSIVARAAAAARGEAVDEAADAAMREAVEAQIEAESLALPMSGRLYDDGIIDPRDTRTVLGLALSAVHATTVEGAEGFGVFRM
ncbi:acyl-CoA carboxylase subunit beta [Baekduia soli]|uniref:Acyl-CoA carboxylase subunit beta n=1 Tax=Baekduia soli TaxID=496014 RepID=A0A5B8U0R6_9ACTN|nr:carboxyl transferase domain-containing protein [Baekduia soli]QEC46445.1 acyl-CoA carboxylase subunit beta [Baekduia soli]